MRIRAISITRTRAVIAGGALTLLVTLLVTSAATPRPTDAEVADIQSSVKDLVNTVDRVVVMPSGAEPSTASIAAMRSSAATVIAASMTADLATRMIPGYDGYLSALQKGETRAFVADIQYSNWTFTDVSLDKGVAKTEGTVDKCTPSIDYAETPPVTWTPCGTENFAVTLVRRDGRWVLSQYEMSLIQAP